MCRDQTGTVCARNECNDAGHLQWRSGVVRSNSSGSMLHPTAAIPHINWLPTSCACAKRFTRSSCMMTRRRSGRVTNLDIKALWCQKATEKERFRLMKVGSEHDPADIGTKTLRADIVVHLHEGIGAESSESAMDA